MGRVADYVLGLVEETDRDCVVTADGGCNSQRHEHVASDDLARPWCQASDRDALQGSTSTGRGSRGRELLRVEAGCP